MAAEQDRSISRHDGASLQAFSPIASRRVFEEVVEQIAHAIRDGAIKVGEKLPSERSLADRLQISRPTLRDAIRVLADARVLEVRKGAGGGAFVATNILPADLASQQADLALSEVPGVLEARRLFEPGVAQLAALYATDSDIEHLRLTIEKQREFLRDHTRFLALETTFHIDMARATGNATIVELMRILQRKLKIVRDMAIRDQPDPEQAVIMHERTLAAILAAQPDLIEATMDEHLSILERTWEAQSGRARLRPIPRFLLPFEDRDQIPDR